MDCICVVICMVFFILSYIFIFSRSYLELPSYLSYVYLYNGYRVFPGGKERPGRDADSSPSSSAVGKKE